MTSSIKCLSPTAGMALAAIFVVTLLFFGPILLPGHSLFGSDFALAFYPFKHFLRQHVLGQHAVPLWNPYVLCGYPYLSDIQAGVFYPGGILFYLFSPETAYGWTVAIHCFIAAAGMLYFARTIGYGLTASLLAALIYGFNGFFLRHVYAGHLPLFQTAAWAPWLWGSYVRAARQPGARRGVVVCLFAALLLMGGFPQVAFYAILFLLGLAVVRPWAESGSRMGPDIRLFLATVTGGFLLAAVQLLPTFEFASQSTRSDGLVYDAATRDSLRWVDLFNLFFPQFFGNPVEGTFWGAMGGASEGVTFWESGAYTGLVAITALFALRRREAGRWQCFFIGVLAVAILFSFGKNNPIFPLIHRLPIFKNFRVPAQMMYLAVTSLAMLAAAFLEQWREGRIPWMWRSMGMASLIPLLAIGVFVLMYAGSDLLPDPMLPNAIRQAGKAVALYIAGYLVLGLIFKANSSGKISVATAAWLLIVFTVADLYVSKTGLIASAKSYPANRQAEEQVNFLAPPRAEDPYRIGVDGRYFFGNSTMVTRHFGAGGYNPLVLSSYIRFYLVTGGESADWEDYMTMIPSVPSMDLPARRLLGIQTIVDLERNEVRTVPGSLPRAFWIRRAVSMNGAETLRELSLPTFDPTRYLILTGESFSEAGSSGLTGSDVKGFSDTACRFLEYRTDRFQIEVDAPADSGFVFLSETFYPGWEARVDGRPVPVYRAHYAFRAIAVPKGRHEIVFRYRPMSLYAGAALSALGLMVCVGVAFTSRRPA